MRLLCAVPRRARPRSIRRPTSPAEQIEQDLTQLAKISDCVRTYSIENGLDQVPAIAAQGRPEGDAGHLARQQPRQELRADFDRGPA